MRDYWQSVWYGVREMLLPPECALCYQPIAGNDRLCAECLCQLASSRYCCKRCAMPLPEVLPNDSCSRCRNRDWHFDEVITLGIYEDKLREAVIACKKLRFEHLRYAVAQQLSQRVLASYSQSNIDQAILVPVPYHWTRIFAGTAATARDLAELIAAFTRWNFNNRMASRIRMTAKQGMLSLAERQQNVRDAFRVKNTSAIRGKHLFLVDDVVTSGATVNELAKQFIRFEPSKITVVAIARAVGH